ncbi:putative alpha/beta-fold hydrolase [Algoriphagus sp. 4150]|uniref:alpha/beta hydrolase n=1 Tax=Algoriphagus sp. 4150 TaxID=2817756 RepID=UPI00285A7C72|nr:alpha/beta fold hydrolase [Algoriphagus sp. 4150]MDR7128376.1 putative alpha/beta-fold hydrolase [Algoriphagus sp. 4150]
MKIIAFFISSAFFLILINSAFAINPDREYILTPDSVGWKYEQLEIRTADQVKLISWVYEADKENDKDTVLILAYPDAGNMSYFVYHSAILADAGYTVVTFDYRGFGKSDDFEIQREYLYYTEFTMDLQAVINTISRKFKDKKIGILGMSMGTTIVSRAYPDIKDKIDFIIGEGFVTDTSAIVDRYKGLDKQILLPEKPVLYETAIQSIDVPLLILTASDDTITTHGDALALQSKLGETCQVIQYAGAHLAGFQFDHENKGFGGWYVEQLERFLD